MITLKNVTVKYKNYKILKNLSLEINKGEFVLITGQSGSGKTTLLNCIGGLLENVEGTVLVKEKNLYDMSYNEICSFRNNTISFIFQQFLLDEELSVYDNILLAILQKKGINYKKTIINALSEIGILNLQNKKASLLSGGEKQRVAVARCIAMNTDIILADEPTGQLDTANSKNIIQILQNLNKIGKTIILVSHNSNFINLSKHIIELCDGEKINEIKE